MSLERFSNIVNIRETPGLSRGVDWNQGDIEEFQLEQLAVRPDETPVVEIHVYTPTNEVYLGGGPITDFVVNTDKLYIDYSEALKKFNIERGFFKITVNVYYNIIGTPEFPELVIKEIAENNREILLSPIVSRGGDDTYEDLIDLFLEEYPSAYERDFALNFGSNNIVRVINFKKFLNNDKILAVRLYAEIPEEIQPLTRVQLIELASDSYIDNISLDQLAPVIAPSNLRGPNFEIETGYTTVTETDFKSWNQLLNANTATSQKIVDKFFSGSAGAELGIDYTGFANFVYYGSANSRIDNFRYKLQNIEFYDKRISELNNVSGSSSGSLSININNTQKKKDSLIGDFDSFEKWLYTEPTSSLTTHGISGSLIGGAESFALTPYPKRLISGQFVNHNTTGSLGDNWYLSASIAATTYDEQNSNQLLKSIPQYIREDSNNSEYEIFINMMGQHFDILWTYANALTRIHKLEENPKLGIDKDILVDIAKSQGWQLTNGYQASQLSRYSLGADASGNFTSTGSLFSVSDEALTGEVWRRIVNNLPHILKSRGTERGIRSLLNIYGIPQTILSIREYGGPKVGNEWPVLTEDRYSYAIKFNSGSYLQYGTIHISSSIGTWGRTSLGNAIIPPITREFRFRPDVTQSMLLYSQVNDDGDTITHIGVQHTGSMSGSAQYGRINLCFASASGNSPMTASTEWVPLYNGEFWNLKYGWLTTGDHYNTGSNTDTTYRIDVQHASDFVKGKISHTASLSITPTNDDHYSIWSSPDSINNNLVRIGGSTGSSDSKNAYAYIQNLQGSAGTFSGSMQEYREWLEFVNEEGFNDHTLNPTSYVSSLTATSSFDTLVRQYTLGSDTIGIPLNTNQTIISSSHPNQSIKNFRKPIGSDKTNAEAYGFSVPTDVQRGNFIPVEETYYVRGASLGASNPRSQKIRLEDNELVRRLSPTNTGEVSSFDNAPLDSNKLGLFYSFADQVNKDIFNHTGRVELDDYVGDPDGEYQQSYSDLRYFSREYWRKFSDGSDVNTFNRIFSQYDFSIFSQIKQTLPERVDEATGLLIEPNILERSKVIITKPIKVDEPFYDAFVQQVQPTASSDSNLQYEGIIDNGETAVLTPSAEKLDDLTGTAYQVRYTGSMRYCTIETSPVDEMASYTASIIDSNFTDPRVGGPVFNNEFENQTMLFQPDHSLTNLSSWTLADQTIDKNEWQQGIATGDDEYHLASSYRAIAGRRDFKPIRLLTENTYPHDVLVKPTITLNMSQSYSYDGITPTYNSAITESNTISLKIGMYDPEEENNTRSRILNYLEATDAIIDSASINNQTDVKITLDPVKVKAYTNPAFHFNFLGNAGRQPASSSLSSSIVNTTVSASFDISNYGSGDAFVQLGDISTNASTGYVFWAALQAAGTDIYVVRDSPTSADYNDGASNVRAGYLGAIDGDTFGSGNNQPLSGSFVTREIFDEQPGTFASNKNGVTLNAVSSSTTIHSTSFPGTPNINISLKKLHVDYELQEVCHRATNELIDNCRKSSIYDTVIYHYSGSDTIANKYKRDFDAAVSESKYLFYSSSLIQSCYRDDFYRYSVQHMATVGTQLTAPSVNSPSVNAALGNKPVVEIFEVNANQIFYNKTPKQPSRNNRLDPGNLSVR
tara:strand:- start:15943 stop:20835 length:4893 start_codon:yes stop_codon:yes gene_type:complete